MRGAETFPQIVSRPTSGPGHDFLPGRLPAKFRSAQFPFPDRLGGLSVLGRREERGESQTNSCCAFLCLQALGPEKPVRENRSPASQGAPDPLSPPSDIRRLLDYLKVRQQGYGSALAFHLANALFQTACRFEELIQLTWSDCQRVGEEIVALRIKGKGNVFQDVPVPGRLSAALLEWKALQEKFKGRRILAPGGIAFAASQFVFAGYSGAPFSNRAFNLRLRAACRALGVGEITAHGLRHSAATILLNQVGKDLREIQELLRHKNIRTTVRYTHVGYEQTRQTAEALSDALE